MFQSSINNDFETYVHQKLVVKGEACDVVQLKKVGVTMWPCDHMVTNTSILLEMRRDDSGKRRATFLNLFQLPSPSLDHVIIIP